MRIDRFTNQLQLALSDAQSIAIGRDHSNLEALHLLQAMQPCTKNSSKLY